MIDQPNPQAVIDDVTSDDKLWALFAYVMFPPIFAILILIMEDKKNRPFLRYHAIQALALSLAMMATYLVVLGCCFSPLYLFALIYFGIQAYNGEYVVIPFLTDFCKQQKWL